jgi:hypothetical protein
MGNGGQHSGMNYDSPFRPPKPWPCKQCGRVHSRWAHCTTDALHLLAERMRLSADDADHDEACALVRYRHWHRR